MGKRQEGKMGALTMTVIAIAGILLGWFAIEVACRPCLQSGRSALSKSLNPDYDPDDDLPHQGALPRKDEGEDEEDEEQEGVGSSSIQDADDDVKKPLSK